MRSHSGWHRGPGGCDPWTHTAEGKLRLRFNCRGNGVGWRVNIVLLLGEIDAVTPRWLCADERPIYVQLEYFWYADGRRFSLLHRQFEQDREFEQELIEV